MTDKASKPGLVNWIGYLAICFFVTIPLAVLTVRAGAWQQGLLLYALSCLGSVLILLVAVVVSLLPRFSQWRRDIRLRALFTVPGTVLLLSLLGGRGDIPAIHDITTDTLDPPAFSAAVKLRGNGSNTLALKPETIEAQLAAYPDLQTVVSSDSIEKAFEKAIASANELGWDIHRQDLNDGFIEAVDTTAIMGFKDDIVIRLRTNATGTLLDLRSVSRVGVSDLGANAARIRNFIAVYQQQG
ncbi:MAG: DUF1499 domain-containing protein [Halioglobus sp.]